MHPFITERVFYYWKNMNKLLLTLVICLVVIGGGGLILASSSSNNTPQAAGENGGQKVTVYKSLNCGCCGGYVSYLKKNGFEVEVVNQDDMDIIKEKYGIPSNLHSCHTTIAGNYFIEGHIPVAGIEKLLSENPDIKGIALPGMPSASPGMPGPKTGPFEVKQISTDGSVSDFAIL